MSLRLFTSFLAIVCFWTTSGVVHAGVILNGDFQNISPLVASPGSPVTTGGWTFENHGGVEVSGSNNFARLETFGLATSDPTIAQTVTGLSIGSVYSLSWDLANRSNSSGAGTGRSFGIFLDSQIFAKALKFDEYLLPTFKTDSLNFVATSVTHKLIFAGELDNRTNGGVGNTDVGYRIDNIQLNLKVTAVPEPMSMLIFSTMGLAAFAQRRRSK